MKKALTEMPRFTRDRKGNMALIFSLSALPVFMVFGLAADYSMMQTTRARIEKAADAAALKGARAAVDFINNNMMAGSDPTAGALAFGQAEADRIFKANVGDIPGVSHMAPTISLTRDGPIVIAEAAYDIPVQTMFGGLANVETLRVAGRSQAEASLPSYFQIVFLVDHSQSMGIGGTDQIIASMKTKIGCAFACHENRSNDNLSKARSLGFKLKIDYVKDAVKAFMDGVKETDATSPMEDLFQVGIYAFGTKFAEMIAPTTDLAAVDQKAAAIAIEDWNASTHGWTYLDKGLKDAASKLKNVGDGRSKDARATYVILVTDGLQDLPPRKTDVDYLSGCNTIKNKGAILITVSTPYPYVGSNYDWITPKSKLAQIEPALKSCASNPNWYFTADNGPKIVMTIEKVFSAIQKDLMLTY